MLNTHISNSYPPAVFGGPKKQGFVDVLACHQVPPPFLLLDTGTSCRQPRLTSAIPTLIFGMACIRRSESV
jgi:hypothetical protein